MTEIPGRLRSCARAAGRQRRKTIFTQADVQRALRGARAAGMAVRQLDIDANGKITVTFASGGEQPAASPLDSWMASRARSS
jgi:hypothetical protein